MNENFVTYELSKKLKEKGYPQCVCGKYHMLGACYVEEGKFSENGCITDTERAYTAPTIPQVLKWFRKEKNIDVEIVSATGMLGIKVYIPYICTYTEFTLETSPDVIRYRQKKFNPTTRLPHEIIPAHVHFKEWEQAAIAGIEYVLDKLI